MGTNGIQNTRILQGALTCAWIVITSSGSAQNIFHRAYAYEFGFAPAFEQVLRLPSGSFILYGEGGYPETGGLSKLDAAGHMQWNQRWEFPNFNSQGAAVNRVLLDGEGNLVVAVRGIYPGDGALVRMDTNGTVLWTRQLGSPVGDVILTSDGNYAVVVEKSVAAESEPWDLLMYKFAPDGTMLFGKRYHCSSSWTNFDNTSKTAYNLLENAQGDYLLAFGYSERICLLKAAANGDFQWLKVYMDSASEPAMWVGRTWSLSPAEDGTLLTGLRMSQGPDHTLVSATIADNGQVISSTFIGTGELDNLRGCVQAADGSLYLCAELDQNEPYMEHGLLHLDGNGAFVEGWRFGGAADHAVVGFGVDADGLFDLLRSGDFTDSSSAREMERTTDLFMTECDTTWPLTLFQEPGDITVIDSIGLGTFPAAAPSDDPLVITPRTVTERTVCSTTGTMEAPSSSAFWYPNPTDGLVYPVTNGNPPPVTIELINAIGQSVLRSNVDGHGSLDLRGVAPGVYLLRSRMTDGTVRSIRIVRE
ncbi:MAG: T9SS type A sorting domain-containing protein [Flavobacteriales bacterium]|nr:T9SS type A sorting domain-containing protein [Flavobacteriales bacterium]